jgi:chromosomal replication initiator protein
VLLIDDIQFIIGKVSTQEEFLHTIDAIIGAGKRLVVSADRAPQALDGVDQRILSRLSMGLVADIQPADLELRRLILQQRLAPMPEAQVGEDVVEFLARTISRNVRELEGGLNKLLAYAQLTGKPVTRTLAEEQLKDILSACRRRITIDEIQRAVCEYYRIDRSEMSSKRRARAVVRPRQVAMYLAKVMTPRSYPEIGRKFGGRDHSTVIHAVRLVEGLRQQDSDMDNDVRALLRQLEGSAQQPRHVPKAPVVELVRNPVIPRGVVLGGKNNASNALFRKVGLGRNCGAPYSEVEVNNVAEIIGGL